MAQRRVRNNLTRDQARDTKLSSAQEALHTNRYGLTPEQMLKLNKKEGRSAPALAPREILAKRKKRNAKGKRERPIKATSGFPQRQPLANLRDRPEINPAPRMIQTPGWFTSQGPVDVSIIVPLYKSREAIKRQIASWDLVDDGLTKEIIYVDDQCPSRSYRVVLEMWEGKRKRHKIKSPIGKLVLNQSNSGFGPTCNVGAAKANGKYLIFLNADTMVTPNWIKPLVTPLMDDPSIGIVGNLQVATNGKIDSAGSQWQWSTKTFQHIGRHIFNGKEIKNAFPLDKAPRELLRPGDRDMVTGACFAIRSDLYMDLGGFDEGFRIGYWEDSDLNMRVKDAGYRIYYEPASRIIHNVGQSGAGGHEFMGENRRKTYTLRLCL